MEIKRENPASRQTRIAAFVRKNTVLLIALALAVLSIALVPPDEAYAGYYDLKTLCCLFGTLAVVCALKNIHFFSILAQRIIVLTGSERTAALALVYITFIGSMLIANDMALITFLPLGYFVFSVTDSKRDMAVVFILQNIAANLGGMLTPFGNPQNLYLYAHYHIANGEFVSIMFPPFAVSIALITMCCLLLPKRALRIQASQQGQGMRLPPARTAFYLALFALTILMVFRLLPAWLVLAILIVSLLIADRKALKMVDYCLLLTLVLLYLCGQHGAACACAQCVFVFTAKKHAAHCRAVLPVHQQCALGHFAFAVYAELSCSAGGREHWRRGHADCLPGQPDYLSGVQRALSRRGALLYQTVFGF